LFYEEFQVIILCSLCSIFDFNVTLEVEFIPKFPEKKLVLVYTDGYSIVYVYDIV